jgi:integrase
VLDLRWEDIDFHWKTIIMRDKVEGKRIVPLTNYVAQLLSTLPRNNEWVFYSPTSQSGKLTLPRKQHVEACKKAGIEGLTLQGLRRSFGSLSEWIDSPVGVVAQVMGHKASAIAEKHYRVRPMELLRKHHQRIEDWMLENAKISFTTSSSRLSLVSS